MLALHKKWLSIFLILIFQIALSVTSGLALAFTPRENLIFPGVSINGVAIGGFDKDRAVKVLDDKFNNRLEEGHIELRYGGKKWIFPFKLLGVKYNIPATVDSILSGQNRHDAWASVEMLRSQFNHPDYPLFYIIDETKMAQIIHKISADINTPIQNATVAISERNIKILPEKEGVELDASLAEQRLRTAIGRLEERPVNLSVLKKKAEITGDDLKEITESIGLGITHFSSTDREKRKVIRAAAKLLNGILIAPGKEFSFNKVMGTALSDKYYLSPQVTEANGRMVLASGGAACQVAGTLYQAVLYSELAVTERWAHREMPKYVSAGQDAAVGVAKMDLKFRNNGKFPVYISANMENNYLVINLLGVKKKGRTIQVVTKEEEDSHNSPRLIHTKVFRIIYDIGTEVKREVVSEDWYQQSSGGR